jgi:hypothetical protein
MPRKPPLSVEAVLAWARAWHAERGTWPRVLSGPVPGAPGETWRAIDAALRQGIRGLPGGLTLPRLLARDLGARRWARGPTLTFALLLSWADARQARHGAWPHATSGPVEDAPGETWKAVDEALRAGLRGLPGNWGWTTKFVCNRLDANGEFRPQKLLVKQPGNS